MREPYRPGDNLVEHLRSAIHEESAAIAPRTSTLIELTRIAADELERLCEEVATLRGIAAAEDAIFDKLVPSR